MWGWGWLQGRLVASKQGFLLGCQFCVPATHGSLSKAVHGCAWLCSCLAFPWQASCLGKAFWRILNYQRSFLLSTALNGICCFSQEGQWTHSTFLMSDDVAPTSITTASLQSRPGVSFFREESVRAGQLGFLKRQG